MKHDWEEFDNTTTWWVCTRCGILQSRYSGKIVRRLPYPYGNPDMASEDCDEELVRSVQES